MIKKLFERGAAFSKDDTCIVKGAAIILMLFHHTFYSTDSYEGYNIVFGIFQERGILWLAALSRICVAVFVFLSAYGMTISYKKAGYDLNSGQISSIALKRYGKLMSGFVFVFACLILFSLLPGKHRFLNVYGTGKKSLLYFIIDLSGLAYLFSTPSFIGTFWYMTLAQLLIFCLPVLLLLYKKTGAVLVPLAIAATYCVKWSYEPFQRYLLTFVLGILFADQDIFQKLRKLWPDKYEVPGKIIKFCLCIILFAGFAVIRHNTELGGLLPVVDAMLAILFIVFMHEYINGIPVVNKILYILGVYSMDIFLIHNFIRSVWFKDFIYRWEYPLIILGVLILTSLAVSVLIEAVKKITGYELWVTKLLSRL